LFVLGLGWNFCFVAGSTLLSNQLHYDERGRVQGTNELLISLASGAGSLLTGVIFAGGGMLRVGAVGLALTQEGRRLYCANREDASVSVFDVFTHAQLARIPAGRGPYGAQTASGGKSLVVTNTYENTASIISTRLNRVTATVEVGDAPAFLAIL
jgi:YVTN family beta-propeller protein